MNDSVTKNLEVFEKNLFSFEWLRKYYENRITFWTMLRNGMDMNIHDATYIFWLATFRNNETTQKYIYAVNYNNIF